MTDITTIPTNELVDDYYASLMDRDSCEKLLAIANVARETAERDGVALEHAQRTVGRLTERVEGNARIMKVIEAELKRRGELHRVGLGDNYE